MSYGLYISAEGAHAQDQRLQVIANNLANVDTVGFKRDLASFQARYSQAILQGEAEPGSGSINDIGGGVIVRDTQTDFSTGPTKRTQIPTDMAIEGDGFFAVRRGNETYLTRAGDFRLKSNGALVTQQGYPVLNADNTPVILNPDGGDWTVTAAGTIRQHDGSEQSVAIVKPPSQGDLVKAGENLFRSLGPTTPVAAAQRRVATGYIELSPVKPTNEMVQLIEASRVLEANVNLMKAQDQMLGGLTSRLLKV